MRLGLGFLERKRIALRGRRSLPSKRDRERPGISPSPLDVKAADKRSVLGVIIYVLWLHERAYVCFRGHLVQWGTGAASSDLPKQRRLKTSSTTQENPMWVRWEEGGYSSSP